jgi:hypothetical protein
VDMATVVRLTKFNEINVSVPVIDWLAKTESQKRARVFLRFLFTVPLLTLGIDGLRPVPVLNENMAISGESFFAHDPPQLTPYSARYSGHYCRIWMYPIFGHDISGKHQITNSRS